MWWWGRKVPPRVFTQFGKEKKLLKHAQTVVVNSPIFVVIVLTPFEVIWSCTNWELHKLSPPSYLACNSYFI